MLFQCVAENKMKKKKKAEFDYTLHQATSLHKDDEKEKKSKTLWQGKGVQERGSRGNKWINSWATTWKEGWRGVEQKGLGVISGRFLLSGQWRRTQKHGEDSIKYHMQWPYCHGYGTVGNINQACTCNKEKWDGGRRRKTAMRRTEGGNRGRGDNGTAPICVWLYVF